MGKRRRNIMKSIMRKCCRSNYLTCRISPLTARYDEKGVYPFEKIKPIVEEILQVVIADGKGLEVNTSSYRYGLSDTTPSVEILKRYRELGGKIVTIGSDSHKPEHLGAYIEETKEMLRKAGYTQFCTYERMSPVFHDL